MEENKKIIKRQYNQVLPMQLVDDVKLIVERGLREDTFCSMAMAGGNPLMKSHSGLLIRPRNCRAYDERLST